MHFQPASADRRDRRHILAAFFKFLDRQAVAAAEHLGVEQFADKQGVGADRDGFGYLEAQARDHAALEIRTALLIGLKGEGSKFIDRAAGFVAEFVDDFIFRIRCQQGNGGGAALFERSAGGRVVVHRQGELGRPRGGDLMQGVDDAAVIFAALRCGNQ